MERKTYKSVCPYCNKDIHVAKSIFMLEFGYNKGFGKCPHCNETMEIEYNEKEQTMSASKMKNN
jgi:transcription elongation factor Elf1